VLQENTAIGTVTSGSFTPWLQRSLAMARVSRAAAAIGTRLQVDVRGVTIPATVVGLPFYKRGDPPG
jgi:aminomethyltransferase